MTDRTIRYRCPTIDGCPLPGSILMGDGPRVHRAYRVLAATKGTTTLPGLGVSVWRLTVESISRADGLADVKAGAPRWSLKWDARR